MNSCKYKENIKKLQAHDRSQDDATALGCNRIYPGQHPAPV